MNLRARSPLSRSEVAEPRDRGVFRVCFWDRGRLARCKGLRARRPRSQDKLEPVSAPSGSAAQLFPRRCRWIIASLVCIGAATAQDVVTYIRPPMVWFPPSVPVYGEAIADTAPRKMLRVSGPPSGLADFVSEKFYPPLSTRLHDESLGRRMSARLDAYRATRGSLLNELTDKLTLLHGEDEETRRNELRTLALQQQPRLAALEREADEIRRALIDGGLTDFSVDWNRRRRWTIGVSAFRSEQAEREAEFQVVRAAAFYQNGLSPEQRGLLLELAYELQGRAKAAQAVPGPRKSDPAAMFFSPATSRFRMPKNPPADLVAKIARFNAEKMALKQALRDAVFAHDRDWRGTRADAFAALADQQHPRLVELEKLAEEIRVGFASAPRAPLKPPPHIPPGLLERIDAYNRDRKKFIDDFEQALRVAARIIAPPPLVPGATAEERAKAARKAAEDRISIQARVARAFQENTRERFEEMRQRFEIIQADLKLVAAGQFDPETGRPLTAETLLQGYGAAMDRFDAFGREETIYSGYRMAMFMPGLSPEQRRLLFNAAIVGLAQPLPFGELMPSGEQPLPQS
jgi:hypothetical protein